MSHSRLALQLATRPRVLATRARHLHQPASPGFALRRAAGPARAHAPLPPLQRLPVRCMASGGGDKSWAEIASEAAELGTNLAKKLGSSVKKAVGALVPSEADEQTKVRERERQRREDVYRPEDAAFGGGLLGGLMGRAVGSALRSAVGALGEQLRQAQEQVADVQDRAARAIESDSRLRAKLGGSVQAGPVVSQSSATSIVNGRRTQRVTLLMPVVGAGGRAAQAQVQFEEGDGAAQQLSIAVQLPSGEVVRLDGGSGGGGGGAGQVIDVDWRPLDSHDK